MSAKSYLQFAIEDQTAKLTKCEPKKATRGDKEVVNTYSHWELTGHAHVLAYFHPNLRSALLVKTATKDLDPDHRPLIQFPEMGWIPWDWKSAGYALQVHRGGSGHSDIRANVEVIDQFRFKVLEGDRVTIRWRTKSDLGDSERGILTGLVGQTCKISLLPPDADGEQAAEPARKGKQSKAEKDARQTELAGATQ